jgi:hypothetical protein
VGKTVKVDKTTLMQERGKYARLCVQVDLTKPLLAMFTIKGRKYNVEYEGLYMLCLTCGKFGHYKEGCPEKGKVNEVQQPENNAGVGGNMHGNNIAGGETEGPWRVVQKQRRGRKNGIGKNSPVVEGKGNNVPVMINVNSIPNNDIPKVLGSRFVTLSDDHIEINQEDMEREGAKEVNDTEGENHGENFQRLHEENMHQLRNKKGTNKGGGKLGEGIKEKVNKDPKLAARGGGFKSKNVAQLKKGVENIAGNIGSKRLDNLKVQYEKPKMTHMATTNKSELQKGSMGEVAENVGPCVENILGLEEIISPNIPRPPNMSTTPLIISNTHSDVDMGLENEIFEDAHDQGSVGTNDSDTEVVRETLGFDQ